MKTVLADITTGSGKQYAMVVTMLYDSADGWSGFVSLTNERIDEATEGALLTFRLPDGRGGQAVVTDVENGRVISFEGTGPLA